MSEGTVRQASLCPFFFYCIVGLSQTETPRLLSECKTLPAFSGAQEHKCIFPFKYQVFFPVPCTSTTGLVFKLQMKADLFNPKKKRRLAIRVAPQITLKTETVGALTNWTKTEWPWTTSGETATTPVPSTERRPIVPFVTKRRFSTSVRLIEICSVVHVAATDCSTNSSIFNVTDGVCVASDVEKTLDASTVGYAFKFESGASSFEPAPLCKSQSKASEVGGFTEQRPLTFQCICSSRCDQVPLRHEPLRRTGGTKIRMQPAGQSGVSKYK